MRDAHIADTDYHGNAPSPPRYLSGAEVENVVQLLIELKDTTLSRASYQQAIGLIAQLGGEPFRRANGLDAEA